MSTVRPEAIRKSVISGTWYPGSQSSLRSWLDQAVSQVEGATVPGALAGLISPHAGFSYSGRTAAHAYAQLRSRAIDTVVILAPSHRAWLGEAAVSEEDAYETPLGCVPLDREFIGNLGRRLVLRSIRGDSEHAVEIQLPFLQHRLKAFKLVPILVGADDPAAAWRIGTEIADTSRARADSGEGVLLVASSDLHHIDDYAEVVRRDRAVVEAVTAYDLERLAHLFRGRNCTVCGRIPILAVLHACRLLGADTAQVLAATNSGDVTDQRRSGQYTVGYMAAAIYRTG